ncbi:MAG: FKBP-type peptidyl-prolyl cis-trans isomerase [Thermoleophilia bacterium]
MQATRGAVVSFTYTLTDDDGNTIDSSENGTPLVYLHGYENIVPGLEKALEGVGVGFRSKIVVEAAEAYGETQQDAIFEVGKDKFPPDMPLNAGMQLAAETVDGTFPLTLVEVKENTVVVDANHPLAGKRLHFDVEVVDIRSASEEELAAGRPQ